MKSWKGLMMVAAWGMIVAGGSASTAWADGPGVYPETKRTDVAEEIHGTTVGDPFRWLEDSVKTNPEVASWVEAQNKVTFGYLEQIPERETIKKALTDLWNYEKYTAPSQIAGKYFYFYNNGLQNQNVLYVMDSLGGEPRVLLDPNTLSADGTVALAGLSISDDARFMAYGLASAGSDWSKWSVRDVTTGKDLPDLLEWVKFSGASWTTDNKGFFYSRYPAPKPGEEFHALNKFHQVYYHRVGTSQDQDVLVYHRPDEPEWNFGAGVTEDGRYLIITVSKGTDDKYRVLYRDLLEPYAAPIELIGAFENEYSFIGNDGGVFYFKTDLDAPKGRVVAIDIRKPGREHWKEIIPQAAETLGGVGLVNNMFVASYLKDAVTRVRMFSIAGEPVRDVDFPGIGTAGGFGGRRTDTETFYSFASFTVPPSIYRYDMVTGKSTLMRQAKVDVKPDDFETKQVFYTSKDGTRVPMFVVHKKGISLDGNNPTLLYGYGGFNISLTPTFSISNLLWLKMGGVYAMPNLRGGGEYGEEWHQAGTKLKKQNVFDDFIAAAEWLISNGYTKPAKLAISGGSNGGLLVGAAMIQRPDLFGVALPAVGVMDMLRFHKFSAGRYWVDDYGSADNPEEFKALLAYSPYHTLKEGVKYPATLVTTADTDDRVVPGHSFKFAAKLQCTHAGEAPVMIRIETKAGHGAGKPTAKIIEEAADRYAFTVKNLGMTLPAGFGGK